MDDFIGIVVSQTGTQEAGERYVGATHVAIQAAVDYCNSMGGGKIFIEKGTYDIQSPINLYSNIEVYGEGIGTVLKPSFPNSGDVGCLQAIGSSGAELENIYIHDLLIGNTVDTKVGRYGIYCSYVGKSQTTGLTSGNNRYDSSTVGADKENKVGLRIENCHVQNNIYGIYLNTSNNNTITCNTVQNNGGQGIFLNSSASSNTITGNTVQNNVDYGINLSSSANNTVTGNTVQNNNIGIWLYSYSNNNTITGNTVQNNNSSGIYLGPSSNNTITGNTVQNNNSYGICLDSDFNNTITGNTVQNNSNFGIYLILSSNNTITGNTVQNNNSYGIYLYSSSNNSITGNTVQNNGGQGIFLNTSANNNTVTGNISRGNPSTNIQTASSYNNLINGNNYGSSSYGGSGNVTSENIQQA